MNTFEMPKHRIALSALLVLQCIAASAQGLNDPTSPLPAASKPAEQRLQPTTPTSGTTTRPTLPDEGIPKADLSTPPDARIIRGNDKVISGIRLPYQVDGPVSAFKFEDAPISDVVHMVLRDILKVDYVLHQPVNGSVTLATRSEVSPDQAVALLESALQASGIFMARDARGVYHVGRPEALKGIVSAPRQVGNGPLPPGQGVVIIPLQYIGATEMATILRPMMQGEALLRVDNLRNLLVLTGTRTQAEGWLDMVSTFDVDLLKGMSVGLFPLKHISSRDVEAAMRLMTGGASAPASAAPSGAAGAAPASGGTGGSGGAAPASAVDMNPLFGALRIMPIEKINSLLVVTPRAAYLEEARQWIERLDRPGLNSTEPQLFVYPVQNGSARNLAAVLSGLFGSGQGGSNSAGTGVAPGLTPTTGSTPSAQGFGSNQLRPGTPAGAQNQSITSVTIGQGTKVIADEINNAIIIYSTQTEFSKIEATLKRLDVPPTQILIEASIIEVTLSDDLQYGLQWVFSDKTRSGLTGSGAISTVGGGALGGALAGFSYTLSNSLGNVRAVLNALADKSLVKVISSPSLMVLDNHTASIAVGNQQPIQSTQTISTTGTSISTGITYKDTGVSLAVTPSVNAGNVVTMQINQAVTDVGQIDTATGQRAFLQRQINSKVAVRSGETLVLGGLIKDNTTTGKTGLPFLQDLPIVGNLFGTNTKNTARTELLVVITPKVVRSDLDLREVSGDLRERMKGLSDTETFRNLSRIQPLSEFNLNTVPSLKGVVTP